MNRPSAVRPLTAFMAAFSVSVGRMMQTRPEFLFKTIVGSGMIRFVWNSSALTAVAWGSLRLGER